MNLHFINQTLVSTAITVLAATSFATPHPGVQGANAPSERSLVVRVQGGLGQFREVVDASSTSADKNAPLRIYSTTPIGLDVGYRVYRQMRVGLYAGYANLSNAAEQKAIADAELGGVAITRANTQLRYGVSLGGDFKLSDRLIVGGGGQLGMQHLVKDYAAEILETADFECTTGLMQVSSQLTAIELSATFNVLFEITERLAVGPHASISTMYAISSTETQQVQDNRVVSNLSAKQLRELSGSVLWSAGVIAQMAF